MGASPIVLLWILTVPAAYFAWRAFNASPRLRAACVWCFRRFSWAATLAESDHLLGIIAALFIFALLFSPIGSATESWMWHSGRFGEPEENRFVRIEEMPGADGNAHVVVEFGVNWVDIDGFWARIRFRDQIYGASLLSS